MPNDYVDLPPIQYDTTDPDTVDGDILDWCEERLKRGIRFIESQVGYDKIAQSIQQISSYEKSTEASYAPIPKGLSKTRANLIPNIAEDLTAMLTDVRYFWDYGTDNSKYEAQARLANKRAESWYRRRQIGLRIGDVIRYYTVAGTGYSHLYYSRRLDDMMLEAEDPRNVFPVDPISYHTLQECTAVIIRRARTPDWVKEEYHKTVKPDVGGQVGGFFGWLQRTIDGPGERGGPLSKRARSDQQIPHTPTTFVNTMYLRDKRVNKSGHIVRMGPWEDGKPLTPWSYEVKEGYPLYPFGRLIAWCSGLKLHDNTSPYWHGGYPLTKWTLNPWPWLWFGKAPLTDCLPLQASIDSNLRVIDDHSAQVAQPGATADRNVSKAEFNKFNTRSPGAKIRTNMASGKGIVINNPPPLDMLIWEVIKWCVEMMGTISGKVDPSVLTSLAQMPSDDTIDSFMKAMTPGIRLRSRILEGCYTELAEQFLYCIFEFDSLAKRVNEFGPQAVTKEDFDFAGGTMIPDDVPDGEPGDIAGSTEALSMSGSRPLWQRAKAMLMAIQCKFDPSSLLNTAAQQELMKYFLLAKMGYCSVFTLMEKMGIQNFAPSTVVVPTDELSRLKLQQNLGIGMVANAQGRKATDQSPPSMGQTGNGPTITTT